MRSPFLLGILLAAAPSVWFDTHISTAAEPIVSASPSDTASAWEQIAPYSAPPPQFDGQFGTYPSPLQTKDKRIDSLTEWQQQRGKILTRWQKLLGPWPEIITDPVVEILSSKAKDGYTQHRVQFLWTPDELTTGYLLIPDAPGPHPAVLTVYYEPETAIGQGKPLRDFAVQLTQRGFVTLSIGTTQATAAQTYSLYYPNMQQVQTEPLSMLAYAAANAWHVLASRPEVDSERIGIVGHSFGGKWAMFASCLYDKFACAVWSDPGIMFDDTRSSINYWEPWYLGFHPKPWRKRGLITTENPARGLYPQLRSTGRDLHELHALMAPRPFLVSGGSEDPPSRWQALNHSRSVNALYGHHDRVAMHNRPQHGPTQESNAIIYAFFEHWLIDSRQ